MHTTRRLPPSAPPSFSTAVADTRGKKKWSSHPVCAPNDETRTEPVTTKGQRIQGEPRGEHVVTPSVTCWHPREGKTGSQTSPRSEWKGVRGKGREREESPPSPPSRLLPEPHCRWHLDKQRRGVTAGKMAGGRRGGGGRGAHSSRLRMSRSIHDTARPAGDSSRMITTGTAVIRHGRGVQRERDGKQRRRGRGDRGRSRRAVATAPV